MQFFRSMIQDGVEYVILKRTDYDEMAKNVQPTNLPADFVERVFGGENKIRVLRESVGWKTGQLAEKVGVSQPHISGIERGANKPSLDVIKKIASALNVDAALLL